MTTAATPGTAGTVGHPVASRLLAADLLRVGGIGLRTRRLRTALSGLGIAIGIAAMVAVVGISSSSKADLLADLDRLGTNLLTVAPGQTLVGDNASLPEEAPAMIGRIGPVRQVSAVGAVSGTVRRSDHIPAVETGGITIYAARLDLLSTLSGTVRAGRFLNAANARDPAVVLGSVAADHLGIADLAGRVRVYLAGRWFTVVGILDPLPLAPDLDSGALVGWPIAESLFGFDGSPTTVYLRADPDSVPAVRAVLAATANPRHPDEVTISRPSDALAARVATKTTFTALLLGLGSVALLVGGVGIANVMVIAVLERRSEIGLRRALGATRRHIGLQFMTEASLLSLFGGLAGSLMGAAATAAYGLSQSWRVVVPPLALIGGVAAALVTGVVAGSYPALQAARLAPTDALRTV